MYIETSSLPEYVKKQVKALGHRRADIKVNQTDEVSPEYPADDGSRGVFSLVNLATGEVQTTYGSWGGANPFVSKPVDQCDEKLAIPNNWVAIKGSTGNLNLLQIYANAATLTPLLPAASEPLDLKQHIVLWAHRSLKGGKYRVDHYREHSMTAAQVELVVSTLVTRGYLKVNKNGSSQITTSGRNAAEGLKELHSWSPEVKELERLNS